MEVYLLLYIKNEYDQPPKAFSKAFTKKPSIKKVRKAINKHREHFEKKENKKSFGKEEYKILFEKSGVFVDSYGTQWWIEKI